MANTFIFDDDDQPDMGGGMTPEQDDEQPPEEEGEGSNRTFTMIMIGLGILFVVALLCVGGVWFLNQNGSATTASLAATNEFATQQVVFATQTQEALVAIPTLAPTEAFTEVPTETPVVIFASETPDANLPTIDPVIATAEFQQTQLVETQRAVIQAQTVTATFQAGLVANGTPGKGTPGKGTPGGTPSKLGQTGFADEVGLPILGILTLILLGVIFMARRLRTVPGR